ncbi:hypothetical protein B0H19DRAFT_1385113 [Mycena capillaripes]|nr:hypothetical protein B0H19DRAFT_1385113 [Mycena capillaripes]
MDFNLTSHSTFGHPDVSIYSTGMFSGAHNVTVTAANLTNITQYPAAEPADLRMFPLSDIDLQREICLDDGIVTRPRERQKIRRVYSAIVGGQITTVAMYQGHGAKQARHPNILEVWGVASTGNIHATLFYGDLIPLEYFLDLYKHSHFSTVYIYAYCRMKLDAVEDYFDSAFDYELRQDDCTLWIRSSTSQLYVDLQPRHNDTYLILNSLAGERITGIKDPSFESSLQAEATTVYSLTLSQYHDLCYWYLRKYREFTVSTRTTVELGAVYFCPSSDRFEDGVFIAFLPTEVHFGPWLAIPPQVPPKVVEGGWTRLDASDAFDSTFHLTCWNSSFYARCYWTSHANHTFRCLQITSNFQDYVFVYSANFRVTISKTLKNPPDGYLFLCPKEDIRAGLFSVSWPQCPTYWSLDPSGVKRLGEHEAAKLGFPSIQLTVVLHGWYYDESVYTGVRQFHGAKGFDPDSLDVTRHLGGPLFQLSSKVDPPCAYVEEVCDSHETESSMDVDVDEIDSVPGEEEGDWDRMDVDQWRSSAGV